MNDRKPTVEILIGMIASGKSTYARRRAREGAIIVCLDDLTEMLHGEYRYEQGLKPFYYEAESSLIQAALFHFRDVVVDRTHLTRESRARVVGAVRDWVEPARIVAVEFPRESHQVHARRRFLSDARGRSMGDWLFVAHYHAQQADAEPLDWRAEGFDSYIPMTVDPDNALPLSPEPEGPDLNRGDLP
jgi:predicted kinase